MGVPSAQLVPALKRATSPPGVDLHPNATTAMWAGYVEDALWTAVLKGVISGYAIDTTDPLNHQIVPVAPNTVDLPGQLGQLVVEFAALTVISGDLMNVNSTFSVTAGPVKFERQQSANVLIQVLKNLQAQIALSLEQIGKLGFPRTVVINAVEARTWAEKIGASWWVRA